MEFPTNPELIIETIDEKWAWVKCPKCLEMEKIRRTEIRKLIKHNIDVRCNCEKKEEN